jgi:hypothetical protein
MAKAKDPKLDQEFAFLLPPQTAEEREALTKSIIDEGIREPLVVWQEKGILVDGYNRFDVARIHKIKCKYIVKSFKDRSEVIEWIVQNQLGRRNLTAEKLAYFRGKHYLAEKMPVGSNHSPGHNDHTGDTTAARLAEKYNVSEKTIRRDAAFAQGVDASPDKAEILAGVSEKTKKEVIEAKPLHCKRCVRVGMPVKNCPDCAKLQAEAGKKRTDRKPASGDMKFDWAKRKTELAKVIRHADLIATGYDVKNGDEHKRAVALIGDYVNHMVVWEKKLNREAGQ